ncbi:transcriptional regulator, LytTR family [Oscillibacter sp. PC13]|uniref:LytTR family DNA-binding domain-containing protein n=1 Tax=Oscillibacter sp. PC13 TaxID=1855299 RepID=UPI0008E45FCB|nr:LytTR family DNA-binding domain-containing protein [Oscillibacter sp. PC13]SFQ08236.1 transcriptional regulator, LytTR family [Oscillibacter sp. PC13]
MKITIEQISREQNEEVILRCHEVNDQILQMLQSLKASESGLVGIKGEELHRLSLEDIFYFEVVENRSFFYCRDNIYESKLKLYEFEEISKGGGFFRASKSTILNADKIEFVSPSFSGRFAAILRNGEKVVVSRQYVGTLQKKMGL